MADTHGYHDNKADYLKRLRRIEGQVRGLQRMVEEDMYCIDILTQVSAVTKALQAVALGLLEDHLGHCVRATPPRDAAAAEADEKVARGLRRHRPLVRPDPTTARRADIEQTDEHLHRHRHDLRRTASAPSPRRSPRCPASAVEVDLDAGDRDGHAATAVQPTTQVRAAVDEAGYAVA